jgi:hypothetical protein
MGTVHRIGKSFDPEITHAMGEAFDSAWRDLEASDIFSSQFSAEWARDQIAKRIITMAQRGDRGADHLAEDALDYLARARPPQIDRRPPRLAESSSDNIAHSPALAIAVRDECR